MNRQKLSYKICVDLTQAGIESRMHQTSTEIKLGKKSEQ